MSNGCGPKWLPIKIKNWLGLNCYFKDECDLHDDDYAKGGTEVDRFVADWSFLCSMKDKYQPFTGIRKYARLTVAYIFYWWVRNAGGFQFNYTD